MLKCFYRFLCCLLALALLFANCAFAAAENAITGYVTANTMKVYQYPNPLSKLLGTMSYGEDVLVLAVENGWMKVQNSKGKIGFCKTGSLSRKNPNKLDMFGYVKESGAYVYAKPGLGFKVTGSAEMGDELHVVAMTGDKNWLRVENNGKYGYVQTELMSKTPTWPGAFFQGAFE